MFGDFYTGKQVLVTGHTGFKGGWLSLWLGSLGAKVSGYGLPAPTHPNFHELIQDGVFSREFIGDVRDLSCLRSAVERIRPEVVFHLAAQPLVRLSYREPLETLSSNVMGTANLLEAVRQTECAAAVVIVTSDKCYENRQWVHGYRENDAMGGHDVYSMSKGAAELVVQSWRRSFFAPNAKLGNVATARGGNVIGGGDYAPDRLVPDCIRALLGRQSIAIRNPSATRPWQHVLDCLSGYLWLGSQLARQEKNSPIADAFNFGPGVQAGMTVVELVEILLKHWPGDYHLAVDANAPHEAGQLNLAIDKAAHELGWHPTWGVELALKNTAQWYGRRHLDEDQEMARFSLAQISQFAEDARSKNILWTK